MIVAISPAAEADIEQIGDFIAQDSPRRAANFITELRTRRLDIAAAPEAAPLRTDIAADVRMVVQGSYLIFYRVIGDIIRIERVLHRARDIARLVARSS